MEDAQVLLDRGRLAGSIYLAGRAVEAGLRAVVWKADLDIRLGRKSLDTGHDLRELLTLVRKLGLLRVGPRDDEFERAVHDVARLWFNNMRFASAKSVERQLRRIGAVHKGATMRRAATLFFEACDAVVRRCEVLCQR